MNKLIFTLLALIFATCTNTQEVNNKTDNFANVADSSIIVADTIKYNVRIMAINEDDAENLKRVYNKQLVDMLFESIYQHQAKVYDYTTGNLLDIDDVKSREVEDPRFDRELVSVLQFTEQWRYNSRNQVFAKKVISVHVAYAVFDENGDFFADRAGIIIAMN